MTRFAKHITLVATVAFAVSTIGLPVVINYCTMQGTFRTGEACCACPTPSTDDGARISSRACLEHTELGAPISAAFTVSATHHASHDLSVVAVLPAPLVLQPSVASFASAAHARDGAPPPLLRTSILRI